MPRVTEANALSKELNRDINFETKVTSVMHKTEGMTSLVMVKVRNTQTDMEWLWEKDKFVNRVYLMRELYEKALFLKNKNKNKKCLPHARTLQKGSIVQFFKSHKSTVMRQKSKVSSTISQKSCATRHASKALTHVAFDACRLYRAFP
jgi:hypothetical protein